MFVIVEGPDNSGKSTLCAALRTHFPLVAFQHSGGPPKDEGEFFSRINRLLSHKKPVIFDRFPIISDHVYGPVVRGEDIFKGNWEGYVNRMMARRPIIIYCRPPNDVLMRGMDNHPVKEHETAEHVERVKRNALELIRRYDVVMGQLVCHHYDFTQGSRQFIALLVTYLKEIILNG